jgi:PAS domain-containing protein
MEMEEEIDYTNPHMVRQKAESALYEMQRKKADEIKDADVNKLLHELQVHQIELEMQNEELRQAYKTAETALKKYTMLFDLTPMGYLTLDPDGTICDLNFTGADMLGERRFSLINSNFKLFISQESLPVFNDFYRKLYANNTKESCQVMLGNDNKQKCHVYMEGVVNEDEQQCLLSLIDISRFT